MISPKIESRRGQSWRQTRDVQRKTEPFSEFLKNFLAEEKHTDRTCTNILQNLLFLINFA